ncbi:MAG TPA: flagellar basal-body rod protein FlgF [Candidatus Binatia bacterium]|nr:flagellar basal-body rod protein FlgF [Candidatus Binatia bacterium]
MNSGFYAAFAGLTAKMQALDLLANNLANAGTAGFKGQHEFYKAVTASLGFTPLSSLNRAINNYGVLGGAALDLSQGNLQETGNNLDVAIQGHGFFAVQTAAGVRYTRNGSFELNPKGRLVDHGGDPVLGDQGPLQLPPGEVSVGPNGTLSVAGAVAGKLRVVEFPPGAQLAPEGGTLFNAPAGAARPSPDSVVEQGALEQSNVNPVEGTVSLILIQRQAESLERALSVFQNDFNRTAAQELSRV